MSEATERSDDAQQCSTCYGEGTLYRDQGPEICRDCFGLGMLPSAFVLRERRLREIEGTYERRDTETRAEFRWLVSELRNAHHGLMQILAASLESDPDDPIAKQVRFLANDLLGVYPKRAGSSAAER